MTLGEKLKMHRNEKGVSQEKIAELLGVSRQAVTKWESNQTVPSSDNLLALSSIYKISLDELAENKSKEQKKENRILHSNLTLVAIVFQAAALNICIQLGEPEVYGLSYNFLLFVKLLPLFAASIWMAFNLRYEKNHIQYKKNIKIECLYCVIQISVALFAFYSKLLLVGEMLILIITIVYVLVINPRYMNREFVKKNKKI